MKIGIFYDNTYENLFVIHDINTLRLKTLLDNHNISVDIIHNLNDALSYDLIILDDIYDNYVYRFLRNNKPLFFIFKNIGQFKGLELVDIYNKDKESAFLNDLFKIQNDSIWNYHKFEDDIISYKNNNFITDTLGCNYNCSFCQMDKTIFERNISGIINEMKYIQNKYGNDFLIRLLDMNFLENPTRVTNLLNEIINNSIDLNIHLELTIDNNVTSDLVNLFKKSNITLIKAGIEHLDDTVRKAINKPLTREELYDKLNLFSSSNIKFRFNFICGLPQETDEIFNNFKTSLFPEFLKTYQNIIEEICLFPYFETDNLLNDILKDDKLKKCVELIDICKNNNINVRLLGKKM